MGNYDALRDNPHSLRPVQKLNILPVDGTYHQWSAGESLNTVANYYGVKPEDMITYPGNRLDPTTIGDLTKPNIEPVMMSIVPGGKRTFANWSVPMVTRKNPAAAKVIGAGYCGEIKDGPVGNGTFVWPEPKNSFSAPITCRKPTTRPSISPVNSAMQSTPRMTAWWSIPVGTTGVTAT